MPGSATRANAMDHVVVVLFENRSLDNVLGHLYEPGDGKTFEGVIGKGLTNPIPEWAEHGAERKVVPYTVEATDMDSPNPDSGEEYYHTNTQLFNVLDGHNRFKIGEGVTEPWNAPPPGATPTMDGFVTDYISTFTGEVGRQRPMRVCPDHDRVHPEQVPVLNGMARQFGCRPLVSEVPSQTFMNRSFWTAATSSGLVVNSPAQKWFTKNDAERSSSGWTSTASLEGLRVRADVLVVRRSHPLSPVQGTVGDELVRFPEFEQDAAAEPCRFLVDRAEHISGHGDYHPAIGRAWKGRNINMGIDPPSAILGGEAFLERVFSAYRYATSPTGSNVWNTTS